MKKSFKVIVFIVAFAVALMVILYNCAKQKINNEFISTVKNDYFYEVNNTITVGKMLDTICSSGEWSFEPSEVSQCVTYKGTCNGETLELSFLVFNFAGELRWRVGRMTYGGKSLPNPDENAGFAIYEEYLLHK